VRNQLAQKERTLEQQVRQVMADILGVEPDSIDVSTAKDSTAAWDSLNHINLVVALEQEFQTSFDVSEIESMLTFSDILETLERKLQR
jgi:acyl carrier protein